jgi:hypothetical protein
MGLVLVCDDRRRLAIAVGIKRIMQIFCAESSEKEGGSGEMREGG